MHLSHKLIIPIDPSGLKTVRKLFTHRKFDQRACGNCTNKPNRFNGMCAVCPAFLGVVRTYDAWQDGSQLMTAIPVGRWEMLERMGFRLDQAVDHRPNIPWRYPLYFTGTLRDGSRPKEADQVSAIRTFIETGKSGFFILPPRAGKTVCGVFMCCHYRTRTLITASQADWLYQFYTFGNHKTRFYENTNLAQLEAQGLRPVVTIEKPADWALAEYADVVLQPYQSYLHDDTLSSKFRDNVYGKFSLLMIDEADLASAEGFSSFIGNSDATMKIALTATFARKDGMELVATDVIGPVRSEVKVDALVPMVNFFDTGFSVPGVDYGKVVTKLGATPERTLLLFQMALNIVFHDPNRYVVISAARVDEIKYFQKLFTQYKLDYQRQTLTMLDENLLVTYMGDTKDRDKTLQRIANGEHKIVVGMNKLVRRGIDCGWWTDLILTHPIASKIKPDPEFLQLSRRVCTIMPGQDKPIPVLHYPIDDNPISRGCAISTFIKSVLPLRYPLTAGSQEAISRAQKINGKRKTDRRLGIPQDMPVAGSEASAWADWE